MKRRNTPERTISETNRSLSLAQNNGVLKTLISVRLGRNVGIKKILATHKSVSVDVVGIQSKIRADSLRGIQHGRAGNIQTLAGTFLSIVHHTLEQWGMVEFMNISRKLRKHWADTCQKEPLSIMSMRSRAITEMRT